MMRSVRSRNRVWVLKNKGKISKRYPEKESLCRKRFKEGGQKAEYVDLIVNLDQQLGRATIAPEGERDHSTREIKDY